MGMGQPNSASLPGELMAQVRKLAQAEDRSTDEVVQEAVERLLRSKRRQKLYEYGERQARELGIKESDVPRLLKETRQNHRRGR
jgi:Arc/MetJ-type ribon-helix-helix transcriptional regulator